MIDALAAEKGRSNTIPRYAMLDVWAALRGSDQSQAFESFRDEHGYAETWARLMHDVRAIKAEQERDERCGCAPGKLVQKWDGGNLAMLCSTCYRIVGYAP